MVIPEVHILYYSPSVNRFTDENWCVIHDLHQLFDTWQLAEWKKTRDHGLLTAKNGDTWKLYYMSDDEEDDLFDCISWNESFGVPTDREQY